MINIEEFLNLLGYKACEDYFSRIGLFSKSLGRTSSSLRNALEINRDDSRWKICNIVYWERLFRFDIMYNPASQLIDNKKVSEEIIKDFPIAWVRVAIGIDLVSHRCSYFVNCRDGIAIFYSSKYPNAEVAVAGMSFGLGVMGVVGVIQDLRLNYQSTVGKVIMDAKNKVLKTEIENFLNIQLGKARIPNHIVTSACNRYIELSEEEGYVLDKSCLYYLILYSCDSFVPVPLRKLQKDAVGLVNYSRITCSDICKLEGAIVNYCDGINDRIAMAEKELIRGCKNLKSSIIRKYGLCDIDLNIKINDKDVL